MWSGLTANNPDSYFEKLGLVELPSGTTYTATQLPWQHKAGSDAEKLTHNCPHGGCTWEMCNPPSDTWTNKAEWKAGDKSDMDWAQPDYCFSYNRASQPSPSRLCQRALTSLARAVPQRSKR